MLTVLLKVIPWVSQHILLVLTSN